MKIIWRYFDSKHANDNWRTLNRAPDSPIIHDFFRIKILFRELFESKILFSGLLSLKSFSPNFGGNRLPRKGERKALELHGKREDSLKGSRLRGGNHFPKSMFQVSKFDCFVNFLSYPSVFLFFSCSFLVVSLGRRVAVRCRHSGGNSTT